MQARAAWWRVRVASVVSVPACDHPCLVPGWQPAHGPAHTELFPTNQVLMWREQETDGRLTWKTCPPPPGSAVDRWQVLFQNPHCQFESSQIWFFVLFFKRLLEIKYIKNRFEVYQRSRIQSDTNITDPGIVTSHTFSCSSEPRSSNRCDRKSFLMKPFMNFNPVSWHDV